MTAQQHEIRAEIVYRPTAGLTPYARNSRTHTAAQVAQIAASIREFGFTNPILVDGGGVIIAGHARALAAEQLGLAEVPTIALPHLSEAQKRAYVIADNQLALNAGWNEELLRLELVELKSQDFDLSLLGFDVDRLSELTGIGVDDNEPDPADIVPEVRAKAVSRLGDVWLCDGHRVLCGDSTNPDTYALALAGKRAAMCWTDPPYNVAYTSVRQPLKRRNRIRKIDNDDMGANFHGFLVSALKPMLAACDGAVYIAMSNKELVTLHAAFVEAGGYWANYIIWHKSAFVMGRADYHHQYEPMLYGWPEGKRHYWCGDRDQGDVWQFARPQRNDLHPTMKPVELIERAVRNSSRAGDVVLDPFGGSGSTLMAADRAERLAVLIELDARYADVIVRRWQDFTGKIATREGDGVRFNDAQAEVMEQKETA